MKITFEEVVSRKDWLHAELLNSLTGDLIDKAKEDGFYEVKLLVNGEELEPNIFNDIVNNIGKYVDKEAEKLIQEKFEKAEAKIVRLSEIFEEASYKIRDEFDIPEEEY